MSVISSSPGARVRRAVPAILGCLLAVCVSVPFATAQVPAAAKTNAWATIVQCVTAVAQAERAATFSGEMTSIPGSARMEMRIELLERMPAETGFRAVNAPGLGVWRVSAPGVKAFRYIKQVTNLSAPAFYRGAVRFRWLSARGHLIKAFELRTPRCQEPATPAPEEGSSQPSTPTPAP
ncbi:MAG TPA: hypothetical protein VII01_03250 [Solirubrobacteraceae bacterium]